MTNRFRRWAPLSGLSLVVLSLASACAMLTPSAASQPGSDAAVAPSIANSTPAAAATGAGQVAVPTPRSSAVRAVAVQRGSVTQTLSLDGVVVPQSQEPISFTSRTIVDDVKVKAGQAVKQGDVLIDFSKGDLQKTLDDARARLSDSQAALEQARLDAQTKQAAAIQQAAVDAKKKQQAVTDAEISVRQAEENLAHIKAGTSRSDLDVALTSVTYYGETQVKAAQAALDNVLAGADQVTVQAAQRDVANAQLALKKAQADLDTLMRGADPAAIRTADGALQRAQAQLQITQAAKIDPKASDPAVAKIQHDQAIQDAQLAVDAAQAALDKLKQPPSDMDVQSAKNRILDAQATMAATQAKLDGYLAGPNQADIDAAQNNLEHAKHAMAELQAHYDDLKNHPTPQELHDAENRLRGAQAALASAQEAAAQVTDTSLLDLSGLETAVNKNQAAVTAAEQALANIHLRAPFDGVVVSVRAKVGEAPPPSQPVIFLARPAPPIVRLDLDEMQFGQFSVGQTATIKIDDANGSAPPSSLPATVTRLIPAAADGSAGASARLDVKWPDARLPKFNTPATVTVPMQQKQDVLVVPKNAVRTAGNRTTVEVQDGSLRRLVNVQVGIRTDSLVEIVSGLAEGQLVLTTGTS